MKFKFSLELKKNSPIEISLDKDVIRLGRDLSCDIVFDAGEWGSVSRYHAELRFKQGQILIADLDSTYGTFLNDERVRNAHPLKIGDIVTLGLNGPSIQLLKTDEAAAGEPENDVQIETVAVLQDAKALQQTSLAPQTDGKSHSIAAPVKRALKQKTKLELLSDDGKRLLRTYNIEKDRITLGRGDEADLKINASAPFVSRRHAELVARDGGYLLSDLNSFNGTFLNGNRITAPTEINYGDVIQLGLNGSIVTVARTFEKSTDTDVSAEFSEKLLTMGNLRTIHHRPGFNQVSGESSEQTLLLERSFNEKDELFVGRSEKANIRLDGLQISYIHARFRKSGGQVVVEDENSTNGVYLNGERINGSKILQPGEKVQIGPYLLEADVESGVKVYDNRSRTRIDVIDITKVVSNNSGGGTIKLLDSISLTIQPNEFVGLLGPSGAGKSTFMDALNGMRPASDGSVLVNEMDLYQQLDALKQSIGYVPQDDIIHRELTVYRTLYYVAKLRLSQDVTDTEIDQIINEVMDVTGLSERRDVPINQLSGGQRKRVSIAVELITKPSVIYLDEPTSGLDPATEEKIMVLFRQIAESGRTVILTTHAMENVKLFDKIVLLMRGKLVFYGKPQEALDHVGAKSFKELYDKLEEPIEERLSQLPALNPDAAPEEKNAYKKQKEQIIEQVAEEWKERFLKTPQYEQNVVQPAGEKKRGAIAVLPQPAKKRRAKLRGAWQQWATLSRRYTEVLKRDKFNLLILFGQAPVIALLTYIVVSKDGPRDFPYFMLALVAIWFGTSVSAREIIRERAVYNRERMVNLGLLPYVGSKLIVLSAIVGLQCLLLFGTLKILDAAELMKMPGVFYGLPQLGIMILTAMVGIALGLLVSAVVKTSEMATSLVPLILIPQILFAGLVSVPKGPARYAGVIMPATWSFDEMKRLSRDKVLVLKGKDEDAQPAESNEGRGLYKEIKYKNDQILDSKQKEMEDYRARAEQQSRDFERQMEDYQKDLVKYQLGLLDKEPVKPQSPAMEPIPPKATVEEIPEDLSDYVDFLHPWGHKWLNPLMLLAMFVGLIGATLFALRRQDVS